MDTGETDGWAVMNKHKLFAPVIAALFLIFSHASDANATPLVKGNDAMFGVDSITIDTAPGGLEWLDLTLTVDITFDDLNALVDGTGFIVSGPYTGWRHASETEVKALFTHHGFSPVYGDNAANLPIYTSFVDFLGETGPLPFHGEPLTWGFTASTFGSEQIAPLAQKLLDPTRTFFATAQTTFSTVDGGGIGSALGHWLVRPRSDIPEPTTLALFGFALVGLGYARRRRAA